MSATPADRRYILRTAAFMSGYVTVNLAAITGAFDDIGVVAAWVLALAVAEAVRHLVSVVLSRRGR